MHINFFSNRLVFFTKETVLNFLPAQPKRILTLALVALGCLAICYATACYYLRDHVVVRIQPSQQEVDPITFTTEFPQDLLLEFFSYLSAKDLTIISLVNKKFKIYSEDDRLWQSLCQRDFKHLDPTWVTLLKSQLTWKLTYQALTKISIVTNADGTVIEGVQLKGNLQGQGKKTYTDGRVDEGLYKNNRLVKGKVTLPSGETFEGEFEGFKRKIWDIFSRLKSGRTPIESLKKGKIILPNKLIIEGLFEKAILKKGKVTFSSGLIKEGLFENGILKEGTVTFPDGIIKEGLFENGILKGKIIFPDGTRQEGIFENETNRTFKGTTAFPGGQIQKGLFENATLKEGTTIFPDGTRQEGIFENGTNKTFKGTVTFPDGRVKKGLFEGVNKAFEGTITFPNGTVHTGLFHHNHLLNGTITESSFGIITLTEYKDGKICTKKRTESISTIL